MPLTTRFLNLPDAAATDALAAMLAPLLEAGDTALLRGPLGAGKSHLARGIIQTLQAPHGPVEDVPSPTYTLVQTYAAGPLEIVHADLYRLSGRAELDELGLPEAFETALCLVEWPERLGDDAPASALRVEIDMHGTGRRIRLSGLEERWGDRLAGLDKADD